MPEGIADNSAPGPTCDACRTVSVVGATVGMSTVNYGGFEMVLCNNPVDCRLRATRKSIWKVYVR